MGFTERQKTELKNITKEVILEFMKDEVFMNIIAKKVADLVTEQLTIKTSELETKINNIQSENEELRFRIDNMEQKLKLDQLRLYGVKEENDANLKQYVEETLSSKLGLNINLLECYRAGKHQKSTNTPRVIKVKFENSKQRNLVFSGKRKFKGCNIVIAEELTRTKYELLMFAKEKLGKKKVWSTGGKIYTMINNKKVLLKNEEDISNIVK